MKKMQLTKKGRQNEVGGGGVMVSHPIRPPGSAPAVKFLSGPYCIKRSF